MRRGCHATSMLTCAISRQVTCRSGHVIEVVASMSTFDVAASPCQMPACLMSHLAMSACFQLCEGLYTWTVCTCQRANLPRVTGLVVIRVVNNFHLWHGVHVVGDGVLSSSHLFDKWLTDYSCTTTIQSLICPALPCDDCSHHCWVWHSVVL